MNIGGIAIMVAWTLLISAFLSSILFVTGEDDVEREGDSPVGNALREPPTGEDHVRPDRDRPLRDHPEKERPVRERPDRKDP